MHHDARSTLGRARSAALLATGVAVSGALAAALVVHLARLLPQPGERVRVESLVDAGISAIGVVVAVWLGSSALLALGCVAARAAGSTWRSGERLVLRCAPGVVRRALVLAVGAGLGLGVASTATAAPEPSAGPATVTATTTADLEVDLGWAVTPPADDAKPAPRTDPAPTPGPDGTGTDLASTPAHDGAPATDGAPTPGGAPATQGAAATSGGPATGDAPPPVSASTAEPATTTASPTPSPVTHVPTPPLRPTADAGPATVVVVRGDSLWSIAARHLPEGADDAQVAAAWPAWYAANADVVGSDPDVLLPGQVLVVPTDVTAGAGA